MNSYCSFTYRSFSIGRSARQHQMLPSPSVSRSFSEPTRKVRSTGSVLTWIIHFVESNSQLSTHILRLTSLDVYDSSKFLWAANANCRRTTCPLNYSECTSMYSTRISVRSLFSWQVSPENEYSIAYQLEHEHTYNIYSGPPARAIWVVSCEWPASSQRAACPLSTTSTTTRGTNA